MPTGDDGTDGVPYKLYFHDNCDVFFLLCGFCGLWHHKPCTEYLPDIGGKFIPVIVRTI